MDEARLIRQARKGDAGAFNQLVRRYEGLLYNVAYRILGDQDAAADATQDAFLSAFQALKDFRGGSFRSWLLRIVTNACYDQLRLKQRRPTSSLDAILTTPDAPDRLMNHAEGPEAYAMRQSLGKAIQDGLMTLPPDQRATVVLSDVQGLSYQEIAEATGVPVGTVKSRLNRGRARLRDYLLAQEELLPARYRLKAG